MTLANKTIVVTGCCSGIGADFAKLARLQGARVIGIDRNDPTLTLDGFVKADLGDPVAIDAAMAQLPERIDALANIAGVPGSFGVSHRFTPRTSASRKFKPHWRVIAGFFAATMVFVDAGRDKPVSQFG